jgi:glycine/D-amino acid oxidase-like deaminating enzyme
MRHIPRGGGAELDSGVFDEAYDVIVVGYGFAGGVTAIEAADAGAKVLICEKMPDPGGLSICSGGAVRCAESAEDAFAYLRATNSGATPDDVLGALAEGMAKAESYVKRLVLAADGAALKPIEFSGKRGGNYPFPGWQTFYHTQVIVDGGLDRLKLFPGVRTRPSAGGVEMFWLIEQHVRRRGIDIRVDTPVPRLIRTDENEVRGVVVGGVGGERRIAAKRGVVLACGGFESDDEMKASIGRESPS